MFNKVDIPIIGLVENMSTFICPHCGTETEIFPCGSKSDTRVISPGVVVNVLARIPIEPSIASACEMGVPSVVANSDSKTSVIFAELAGKIASWLSIKGQKTESAAAK